jgi:3-dehydroquinate dehydratase type I
MKDSIDSRICVSISEPTVELCVNALRGLKLAEIRLDKTKLDEKNIRKVFSTQVRLVATFRPGMTDDKLRLKSLISAINHGASFVDIELEADDRYRGELLKAARKKGCKVIVSYHNDDRTPSREELIRIVDSCFRSGGDIAKIACKVNSTNDNARLLGLLDENKDLVVVGMGKEGTITRVVSTLLGSPFTYASLSLGKETALGQISAAKLKRLIGSFP